MPFFSCPCGTSLPYANCCGKYHGDPNGTGHAKSFPENALLLMRSRYAAYALGLTDYIISTTHPQNPHYMENKALWKKQILAFTEGTLFEGLDILEFIDGQVEAFVTFTAHLHQKGPQKQNVSFTEKSSFVKENGKWLYRDCLEYSKTTTAQVSRES